jgi:hypothetical protein
MTTVIDRRRGLHVKDMTAGYGDRQARARRSEPYRGDTNRGGVIVSILTTFGRRLQSREGLRWSVAGALTTAVVLLLATSGSAAPGVAAGRTLGWRAQLGQGHVSSFADVQESGGPKAIGIMIPTETLVTLPTEPSDYHHCFDRDGDGVTAHATECSHTHELVVPLPDAASQRSDVPFKWVLLNWNAHGHVPPGIYDVPHFDVHFFIASIEDTFAIHDGPCGPELVNCDHFVVGKTPVPAHLMHPDFSDVDAVVPAMGNHLIDLSGQEFHGEPFTYSWIYGAYGGHVTFYEQMVALDFLRSRPNACAPIKSPPAVEVGGFYPTQRCIRYDADADAYIVSLEQFVYRQAS